MMTHTIFNQFLNKGTIFSLDKDHLLIGWGKRYWSSTCSKGDAPNFYFPDFFLKVNMPWFTQENTLVISTLEFKTWFPSNKPSKVYEWKSEQQPFFESKFLELETKIKEGELIKAVPYLFEKTADKMDCDSLSSNLSHLLDYIQNYPAFIYGLWDEEEGFVGATPEILFDQNNKNSFETVACAGTCPTSEKNQAICPKLKIEHDIVIEGIKSSLLPFGSLKVGALKLAEFAVLKHLMTPIGVTLHQPLSFEQIVAILHPTPALGAFPKDSGMIFLEKYQMGIPRGRFGAPAGFCYKGFGRCLVAIRNIQWDRRGMQIGAGCGVCSGSVLADELDEIKLKLLAIKKLLGLCTH